MLQLTREESITTSFSIVIFPLRDVKDFPEECQVDGLAVVASVIFSQLCLGQNSRVARTFPLGGGRLLFRRLLEDIFGILGRSDFFSRMPPPQ